MRGRRITKGFAMQTDTKCCNCQKTDIGRRTSSLSKPQSALAIRCLIFIIIKIRLSTSDGHVQLHRFKWDSTKYFQTLIPVPQLHRPLEVLESVGQTFKHVYLTHAASSSARSRQMGKQWSRGTEDVSSGAHFKCHQQAACVRY